MYNITEIFINHTSANSYFKNIEDLNKVRVYCCNNYVREAGMLKNSRARQVLSKTL